MQIYSVRDIYEFPPITWLAHYMIPDNGLALIYGPTNIGKSFVALDLGLSVAAGLRWMDVKTQQGPVVYVAAGEGVPGLRGRLKEGWSRERQVDLLEDVPFHVVTQAVQLHQAAVVEQFIKAVTPYEPKLVVFDTLARCFAGGNENAVEDMGKVIGACDEIRERTGATVLLVHHTGRADDEGRVHERGSTALPSAVDVSIEIALPKGWEADRKPKNRILICRKQKDAEFFHPINFHLKDIYKIGRTLSCVPTLGHRPADTGTM